MGIKNAWGEDTGANEDDREEERTLQTIIVPLPEVRMQIVELMKDGFMEMPLQDFLLMVRAVIRKSAPKQKN